MELTFPIEFVVHGTPISWQAKRAASKLRWKSMVREASRQALPEGHFASEGRLAVTLYSFPAERENGDVDNTVKLVLDALIGHIYLDDGQIERIVVQRFMPDVTLPFARPSLVLAEALQASKPVLYVRISNDPFEDLT